MSHYRPYPAYKDSGVEWIGQVPEHWDVARIKRIASLRNERRNDVSADVTYIGLEDVESASGKYKPTDGNSRQSEDSTVGIFYENDVLYGKLRPYLRKGIVAEMDGCCSTEFLVLHPEKTEPKWLQEWLLSLEVTYQIEAGCEGAKMPRADWAHVGSIETVCPNVDEQQQILSALGHEAIRIDTLIEKKTRFIELLQEKRQALITHAVTKGLDPNVKMKDSGVEWIGQVPEHWVVQRLKHLFENVKAGPFGSALTKDMYVQAGYKVYGQEQVIPSDFSIGDYYIDENRFADLSQYELNSGDILISCVGTFGKIAIVPDEFERGIINPRLIRVRTNHHVAPEYLATVMRSSVVFEQFSMLSKGGTMDVINIGTLSEIVLATPPVDEQAAILQKLDRETARIDTLIAKTEQSITLLKERRSAFITAAVTGQIDLRGEQ